MRTIVVATQNAGKIVEIKKILEDLDVEVKSMGEVGIHIDIQETGTTFCENAIIKAEALKQYTDALILADDSGLEIDYLEKAPGVYSARYLGEDTPYKIKNQMILDKLKDVPKEQRTARFVCTMAVTAKDMQPITTCGVIEGYIGEEARGTNGFGYDPIFFVEEYNTSTAEMCSDLKNKISHRGQALRQMKERLKEILNV